MSATREELRLALLAMFLDAEETAVSGHETCTYPGGVFDDRIWRQEEPETFKRIKRVRRLLDLKPFKHRDARKFGRADGQLSVFRENERQEALLT